jgi:enoyl-CoA hydratase
MSGSGATAGSSAETYVTVEYRERVGLITLDHPQDRNALSLAMTRALAEAVHQVHTDGQAGAIVLTSSGPVFSSGGSVDDLLHPQAPLEDMYAGFVAVAESPLPTVAAVNGPALGAGMNLMLACDVSICTPAARFETRFLEVGLHPGGGHLWKVRERIGRQGAAAMALFGASLSGEEACQRGLVWRCVDPEHLLDDAVAMATHAAQLDHAIVARARESLNESASVTRFEDAVALELAPQQWSMGRPEFADRLQQLRQRLGRT